MSGHNALYNLYQAPYLMKDPGNAGTITVDRQFAVVPLVSTGSDTRTLAAPTKAGMFVQLCHDTDGGSVSLTVTGGYDRFGDTIATTYAAGDTLLLQSIKVGSTYRWQVIANNNWIGPADGPFCLNGNGYYTGTSVMKMWENCPSPADPRYHSLVHEYFNDFRALAADFDTTNEWTLTEDDAANAQALSADAVCGELLLTNKATTDDNAQQIALNQESFKLQTGKKLWFEARFKTAAGATQIDWAVGLVESEDITGVSDNMPANGIVLKKDDGDTNVDIASCDNGENTTGDAVGTWTTGYHTIGFYFDGVASGAATITPYFDGVAGTPITQVTYATMAELAPVFMVRNGDATTTQTMTIDYVKAVQLR